MLATYNEVNKNMNRTEQSKVVNVLYEHVFSEDSSPTAGRRRFVIRVLHFGDTNSMSIGISRQWFNTESSAWLPAQKGHVYFPFKSWCDLVNCIGTVDSKLKDVFANGGNAFNGQLGGRVGPPAEGSHEYGYSPSNNITARDGSADTELAAVTAATTSAAIADDQTDGSASFYTPKAKSPGVYNGASSGNARGGSYYRGTGAYRGGSKRKFADYQ